MFRWLGLIIAFILLSALQTAFFSAWPAPWRSLDLTLVAVVGLIVSFRPRQAFVAAAAAGFAADALTSSPIGAHAVLMLLSAFLLNLLFERVITNVSVLAFAAMNVAAYLLTAGIGAAWDLASALTVGSPGGSSAGAPGFLAALVLQAALSLAAILLARAVRRSVLSRFLLTSHV